MSKQSIWPIQQENLLPIRFVTKKKIYSIQLTFFWDHTKGAPDFLQMIACFIIYFLRRRTTIHPFVALAQLGIVNHCSGLLCPFMPCIIGVHLYGWWNFNWHGLKILDCCCCSRPIWALPQATSQLYSCHFLVILITSDPLLVSQLVMLWQKHPWFSLQDSLCFSVDIWPNEWQQG